MYHNDLDKQEARREEAARIAMEITVAAVDARIPDNTVVHFFTSVATAADKFLAGETPETTLIISGSKLLAVDQEQLIDLVKAWMKEHEQK